jgi:hypothetical protein
MSLSSAGYPAVGYPSLHVVGRRGPKLFAKAAGPHLRASPQFSALYPKAGLPEVTATNRRLLRSLRQWTAIGAPFVLLRSRRGLYVVLSRLRSVREAEKQRAQARSQSNQGKPQLNDAHNESKLVSRIEAGVKDTEV